MPSSQRLIAAKTWELVGQDSTCRQFNHSRLIISTRQQPREQKDLIYPAALAIELEVEEERTPSTTKASVKV